MCRCAPDDIGVNKRASTITGGLLAGIQSDDLRPSYQLDGSKGVWRRRVERQETLCQEAASLAQVTSDS